MRGGSQVGELGLACATALVGRGSCDGRHNGYGRGSPALVDLDAAPRQSSSTSPSALPLIRRSAPRQGRANAKGGAPANATALLRTTTTITTHGDGSAALGPVAARGRAARGPSGGRAGARARKAVGRRRSPTARMAGSNNGEAARRRMPFDWNGLHQLGPALIGLHGGGCTGRPMSSAAASSPSQAPSFLARCYCSGRHHLHCSLGGDVKEIEASGKMKNSLDTGIFTT